MYLVYVAAASSGTLRRVRACGRVRRFGVRVEDGKSFDDVGDGFLAGEASKSDEYFGWITVRKWSEYC